MRVEHKVLKKVYENNYFVGVILNDNLFYTETIIRTLLSMGVTINNIVINNNEIIYAKNIDVLHRTLQFNDDFEIIKEISVGGSAGNIPKWIAKSNNISYYIKGRSDIDFYESETETCVYNIAKLLEVPAIEYTLYTILNLSQYPLCVSQNYAEKYKVISLYRYVFGKYNMDLQELKGRMKYDAVSQILDEDSLIMHNSILLLDYVVGNVDRHLRNFEVALDESGSLLHLIPNFDSGEALFSKQSNLTKYDIEEKLLELNLILIHKKTN